ncbi:AMP-binding protein [Pseudonocardia sp. RS010]|uniref:AMP-binding protein n=1 Tax=Pseudonocardia sp. RS010 TaxID=3385979 RepID=UPI0039A1EC50
MTAIRAVDGACGAEPFAEVTYREADDTADRTARALAAAGLVPGDRVLLICENSVEALLPVGGKVLTYTLRAAHADLYR